jgi:hypothetical protein
MDPSTGRSLDRGGASCWDSGDLDFFSDGIPASWLSKKQTVPAGSSTQAEYMAYEDAMREAIFSVLTCISIVWLTSTLTRIPRGGINES